MQLIKIVKIIYVQCIRTASITCMLILASFPAAGHALGLIRGLGTRLRLMTCMPAFMYMITRNKAQNKTLLHMRSRANCSINIQGLTSQQYVCCALYPSPPLPIVVHDRCPGTVYTDAKEERNLDHMCSENGWSCQENTLPRL